MLCMVSRETHQLVGSFSFTVASRGWLAFTVSQAGVLALIPSVRRGNGKESRKKRGAKKQQKCGMAKS